MKKTRFTETQIVSTLKRQEAGIPTKEICRELGISEATFYNWKKKYGGMDTQQLKELRALRDENGKLKKMYADVSLDVVMLKDILTKKF